MLLVARSGDRPQPSLETGHSLRAIVSAAWNRLRRSSEPRQGRRTRLAFLVGHFKSAPMSVDTTNRTPLLLFLLFGLFLLRAAAGVSLARPYCRLFPAPEQATNFIYHAGGVFILTGI